MERHRVLKGEYYYFMTSNLEILCVKEENAHYDETRFKVGNYFNTEKDAKKMANIVADVLK